MDMMSWRSVTCDSPSMTSWLAVSGLCVVQEGLLKPVFREVQMEHEVFLTRLLAANCDRDGDVTFVDDRILDLGCHISSLQSDRCLHNS